MSEVSYAVPEAHCAACEASIRRSLEKLPGIRSAGVDLTARRVTVSFDAKRTGPDQIRRQIETAGFDIEEVS